MLLDLVSHAALTARCYWLNEACHRSFAASLDGALSPLASAGYNLLTLQFGVSIDDITSSFGSILLGLGCFMYEALCLELLTLVSWLVRLFQNMLAVKFGHRIVYLGSVSLVSRARIGIGCYFRMHSDPLLFLFQMFISCVW